MKDKRALFSTVRQVKIEAKVQAYHALSDADVQEKIENLLLGYGYTDVTVTVKAE